MTAPGYLLLEDGRRFNGLLIGGALAGLPAQNDSPGIGEVVFQTGMTGYQEVITDPSYRGQIVTFTASHIGNTGMNAFDNEAARPALAGIVTRSVPGRPSSWRSEESLIDYLTRHSVPCLTEVDTRALTRHLRESGAMRGLLAAASVAEDAALARVRTFPGLVGRDLVQEVAPSVHDTDWRGWDEPPAWLHGRSVESREAAAELADEFPLHTRDADGRLAGEGRRITLVHCGLKEGIDASLRRRGARVRIVAPNADAEELLRGNPDGIVLSNGPGDPAALENLIKSVRAVIGRVPILGICLGHQILGLALGGRTFKMKYGHHGINHPVREVATGRVLVTSQNHGFAVDLDSVRAAAGGDVARGAEASYVSLNDGVLEGFRVSGLRVDAVQFHPEANGGPHDGRSVWRRAPNPLMGLS